MGSFAVALEPVLLDSTLLPTSEVPLKGGIFSSAESIQVALKQTQPGATIVYTLDASEPTAASTVYTEPILISRTTVFRARAFRPDCLPSAVVTRSFIFNEDIVAQQELFRRPPTYSNDETNAFAVLSKYACQGEPGETETPQGIPAELKRIPTISLVSDQSPGDPPQDPNYPFLGIPVNVRKDFPVSFEWINPLTGGTYSQENCTLHRSGEGSIGMAKGSFEITFKKERSLTGVGKWQGPVLSNGNSDVFPDSKVTKFNELRLRNPGNASWAWAGQGEPRYISDAFMKENARAFGQFTPQRRWVHIYINGRYHGVTDLEEHFDADSIADHMVLAHPGPSSPWKPENIRVLNFCPQDDVSIDTDASTAWFQLIAAAQDAANDLQSEAKWNAFVEKIDLDDYINFLCTMCITRQADYDLCQWRGWYNSEGDQKFHFLNWDGDHFDPDFSLTLLTQYRLTGHHSDGNYVATAISELLTHARFINTTTTLVHPKYALAFKARINQLQSVGLIEGAAEGRFISLSTEFQRVMHGEAWRWGDISVVNYWLSHVPALAEDEFSDAEPEFIQTLETLGLWNDN